MEFQRPITLEQIRQRAYELWERNHQPMGFEIEFWIRAEQELKAERDFAARTVAGKSAATRASDANCETEDTPPNS